MASPYVTFIRTTPEQLWDAPISPGFTRQYWFGIRQQSDWRAGSPWKLVFPDRRVADTGEILEIDPPRRLVLRWQNEFQPEMKAEGPTRCTIGIEPAGTAAKLTVTHSMDRDNSKFVDAVSDGWPRILSDLKSPLETGRAVLTS